MSRSLGEIDRSDVERRNPPSLNERVRRPSCAAGWSEAAYTMARRRDTPTRRVERRATTPKKKWQPEEKKNDREGGAEPWRVQSAMTRYIPGTRVDGFMCLPFPSPPVPFLRAGLAVPCLRDGSYYLLTLQMRRARHNPGWKPDPGPPLFSPDAQQRREKILQSAVRVLSRLFSRATQVSSDPPTTTLPHTTVSTCLKFAPTRGK